MRVALLQQTIQFWSVKGIKRAIEKKISIHEHTHSHPTYKHTCTYYKQTNSTEIPIVLNCKHTMHKNELYVYFVDLICMQMLKSCANEIASYVLMAV